MDNREDFLEHHGVRGMKWGVRRYQNYDGSYTAAGMKRFNKSLGEYEKAESNRKKFKGAMKESKKTGKAISVTNATDGTEYKINDNKAVFMATHQTINPERRVIWQN